MRASVLIAGAGLMGRWHMNAAVHSGARIVGIFDRNRAAAERLAATARGGNRPAAGDDLAAILEQSSPDAVHVCTPLESHVDL